MLSIWHWRRCICSLAKLLLDADPGFFDLLADLLYWHVTSPLLLLGYFFLLGDDCSIGISSNNSRIIHGIPELITNNSVIFCEKGTPWNSWFLCIFRKHCPWFSVGQKTRIDYLVRLVQSFQILILKLYNVTFYPEI
jgi:hypothetical protein